MQSLSGRLDWPSVVVAATSWVQGVRDTPAPFWALESLLREYPISSAEGLALMRLAEALLRVPDAETAIALTADQLGRADFSGDGDSDSPHRLLATLSSSAIVLAKRWLPGVGEPPGLLERLGSRTVVAATVRAIQLLGRQFVLGRHIGEALDQAAEQRREAPTLRFSFDMLGEGARTARDALRYLAAYDGAIRTIAAQSAQGSDATPAQRDGISIKLSALHPRYEDAQRERVMQELVPRLVPLLELAAAADINLTIDAEESDRLELSLEVFDALAAHVQQHAPNWTRLRAGRAGLSDARDRGHRRGGPHRPRAPPALHGAAGQGCLLGRRNQACPGRRLRRLSGVHAQAAHRHRLPGRRARAAGAPRCDPAAVRHAQRRHHRGHRADGARARRRVRDAAPARHGRGCVPRSRCRRCPS